MQNDKTNPHSGNNSTGGDSYGELKAENLQLRDKLGKCRVLGQVFIYYVCVQGKESMFDSNDLMDIHGTYLTALDSITD